MFKYLQYEDTKDNEQSVFPDCVFYIHVDDKKNYELFFMEVKGYPIKGNKKENDFVKLGKELHIAITKLVNVGVLGPVVVGLLVEGKNRLKILVKVLLTC